MGWCIYLFIYIYIYVSNQSGYVQKDYKLIVCANIYTYDAINVDRMIDVVNKSIVQTFIYIKKKIISDCYDKNISDKQKKKIINSYIIM